MKTACLRTRRTLTALILTLGALPTLGTSGCAVEDDPEATAGAAGLAKAGSGGSAGRGNGSAGTAVSGGSGGTGGTGTSGKGGSAPDNGGEGGNGDGSGDAGAGGNEPEGSGGEGGRSDDSDDDAVYLFTVAVYGPDETLQYSVLRRELDFNIDLDDLRSAREFPGYTGVAVIDGNVVTGDSETPFASKFAIGDDLSWAQLGNKLNFGDYFSDNEDGLNFYFQSIRGEDMYFFFGAERTSRAYWNVGEWRILGEYNDTALPVRAGWTLRNAGNRTGVRDFRGPVVWPFFLANDETGLYSDESWLAVYDEETHAEKSVLELGCPGIEQSTIDEDGNLYFSTTFNAPTRALYGKAPVTCIVKVKPDGTLDETFPPNDLTEFTGGFYGVNFRYLGNGKAAANVLHHDRLTGVDFTGEIDPAVEVQISGQWTDEGYLEEDRTLWELHVIDLEEGTSQIVEGFRPEHDASFYTIFFQVDGRTFINVQYDIDELTNNAIYELDTENARVTEVGHVVGDLSDVARVR